MARTRSNRSRSAAPAGFEQQVRLALQAFGDAAWLGEHSPLAAPYLLGARLDQAAGETAAGRRQALRAEMRHAALALWDGPLPATPDEILQSVNEERDHHGKVERYHYLVLELYYFNEHFRPPRARRDWVWEDFLFVSKATFFRDLRAAEQRLGESLLRRLRPSLRPEQPSMPSGLVGREAVLAECLSALQARKTVALGGPSGIGKTALGTALAQAWPTSAVFWLTVRPGLNDQLSSVLFALGHFLQSQGAFGLWHELVAHQGGVRDFNLALGLARHDLACVRPGLPLLCIDEADRLRPGAGDEATPAQAQILEFLDGLCGHAALLLLGQRAVLEADVQRVLAGLEQAEIVALLERAGTAYTSSELNRLHQYTGGNPRLLELAIVLSQAGEPMPAVLGTMPHAPLLQPLFDRL